MNGVPPSPPTGEIIDGASLSALSSTPPSPPRGVSVGVLISLGARTDCEADPYSLPTADPYSLPTVLKSDAASENAVDVLADIFAADMDTVLADMDAADASARRSRSVRSCASFSASRDLSSAFLALATSRSAAAAAATVSMVRRA